ncbi:hypothetical protein DLAC_01028 [Tieghemostelium lacteum]|uniref:Transmembrane protein n=1 Tax=Tieghemostelium lacteum TaxID=361077 RepID=A0A152A7M0_TIELA|nr:hypothetical protein DLAC_01028 [Tieghemostelium lacteum]|eukprot:KYR02208.1 hypothetical protein DLAC_01028 [Tieghemostelium lacteum]
MNKPELKTYWGSTYYDDIGKTKIKIRIAKIIGTIIVMLGITIFFIVYNTKNRITSVVPVFEKGYIEFPEIGCEIVGIPPNHYAYIMKYQLQLVDETFGGEGTLTLSSWSFDASTQEWEYNYTQSSLIMVPTFLEYSLVGFTFYPDKDFSLLPHQTFMLTFMVGRDTDVNLLYHVEDYQFGGSTETSLEIGITKSINIDKNGRKKIIYDKVLSTGPALSITSNTSTIVVDAVILHITMNSNIVETKSIETNADLTIRTLANIGSLLSTTMMVATVITTMIISRFYFKDRSAWVENEIRESVFYQLTKHKLASITPS